MKKKILVTMITAAMVLGVTACGGAKTDTTTESTTVEEVTSEVGLANPWSDVASSSDAAEGAEVGYFNVPAAGTETSSGQIGWDGFRYMKGIAEADGYIGAAELTVRKGLKQDTTDVSGDYNEYKFSWKETVGDYEINCYGNEDGRTKKAIWVTDNFSYAILVQGQGDESDTYGLDSEVLKAVAAEVE